MYKHTSERVEDPLNNAIVIVGSSAGSQEHLSLVLGPPPPLFQSLPQLHVPRSLSSNHRPLELLQPLQCRLVLYQLLRLTCSSCG